MNEEEQPVSELNEFAAQFGVISEQTKNCYIEKLVDGVSQWKIFYDESDKNCQGTLLQLIDDSLFAVFQVEGDSSETNLKFFLNNDVTGAKEVFTSGKGVLRTIPNKKNALDYIDILVKINQQNGKIVQGTVLYSSFRRYPAPELQIQPLVIKQITSQKQQNKDSIILRVESEAYPPSQDTSNNQFFFDESNAQPNQIWQLQMKNTLDQIQKTQKPKRELEEIQSEVAHSIISTCVISLLILALAQ